MKVLITCNYFPPAYLSGGPVRALENLLPEIANKYEIKVLTSDTDIGGRTLKDIKSDDWENRLGVRVYRISHPEKSIRKIVRFMKENEYDIIYLNSLFSPVFTGSILAMRRLGIIPRKNIVLAPRGELNKGALEKKATKKRIYLAITSRLRFYDNIIWQATSSEEENRVAETFQIAAEERRIVVAEDIARRLLVDEPERIIKKKKGKLRIVFLSRITRMKGVDILLDVVGRLEGNIELNIYGVRDADTEYLEMFDEKIEKLPKNIKAIYHGPADPVDVPKIFANHDVFFLPTHGENYGHVIPESLGAGCPVLLSNNTPWSDIEIQKAGWIVKGMKVDDYCRVLNWLIGIDDIEHEGYRRKAFEYARKIEENRKLVIERTVNLFERANIE